jgi:hypothetical protein
MQSMTGRQRYGDSGCRKSHSQSPPALALAAQMIQQPMTAIGLVLLAECDRNKMKILRLGFEPLCGRLKG